MMRVAVIDRRRILRWLVFSVGVMLVAIGAGRIARAQTDSVEQVEIRDYKGEKLGSINDFQENSISGVQYIDPKTYTLLVDGLVSTPQVFTYAELEEQTHTEKVVTLECVDGWSVKALWQGIPLSVLFDQVGPTGEVNTVVFYAEDGYSTSLPLKDILDRNLIIADHVNGLILPPAQGFPFQLVAEDKWGYKWIRWITHIELTDDPTFRGYWESRGYSNRGEVDGAMFGE